MDTHSGSSHQYLRQSGFIALVVLYAVNLVAKGIQENTFI